MSVRYRWMYRLGFTPWDNEQVPAQLADVAEGAGAQAPGRALDIGCGTGTLAVYLAQHGWRVTAIDAIEQALEAARDRGQEAGVDVRWMLADVAQIGVLGLEPGFELIHDRGCFHDLPRRTRARYAEGVSALAAPGATLLLMSFAPNRHPGPAGADEAELRSRLGAAWRLESITDDAAPAPPGPMRNVPRHWYRFTRLG